MICVKVTPGIKTTAIQALYEAKRLSQRIDCPVQVNYDDVKIQVYQHSDVAKLFQLFIRLRVDKVKDHVDI